MSGATNLGHCARCGVRVPVDAPFGLCPRCLLQAGLAGTSDERRSVDRESTRPVLRGEVSFVAPSPEELSSELPHLEVLALLGQGGMGAVYRARQPNLDRTVAVKVLPDHTRERPEFSERFAREARALARLNHPNIVALYDFGRTTGERGLYYFIMEFVDGADLRRLVQRGELKPEEALAIVPQICDALQYAHDEGIVHRDIKPENILVDRKGRVKVADFGLAKILDVSSGAETITREGEFMGTPLYMAPEQRERAHGVDHRADIYSLGVVFYEMLTGDLPMGRFPAPSKRVHVDVRLDEVVLRTLEQEPERRYQHAREVKTEVEAIRASPSPSTETSKEKPPHVASQVVGPARALILTGVLNWVLLGSLLIVAAVRGLSVRGLSEALDDLSTPVVVAISVIALFGSGAMILAGLKMMRLESRGLVRFAAILAMIVTPGNLAGLPVGIWVWVVLNRAEVRAAFDGNVHREPWPNRIRAFLHSTQNCAGLFALIGVLAIAAPWVRTYTFWTTWGFGWGNAYGIWTASLSVAALLVLLLTGNMKPRPLSRALIVLATGLAIVAASGRFIQIVITESRAAAEVYDPDWYPESTGDADEDRVSKVSRAFSEQLSAVVIKSATPHLGPFLGILAGLGLVSTSVVELGMRRREQRARSPDVPGAT